MATNPIGPGTKNVTINVEEELRAQLDALAKKSGVSRSVYARAVLEQAVQKGVTVERILRTRRPSAQK